MANRRNYEVFGGAKIPDGVNDWISFECVSKMKVMMVEVEWRRDFRLLIDDTLLHPDNFMIGASLILAGIYSSSR